MQPENCRWEVLEGMVRSLVQKVPRVQRGRGEGGHRGEETQELLNKNYMDNAFLPQSSSPVSSAPQLSPHHLLDDYCQPLSLLLSVSNVSP